MFCMYGKCWETHNFWNTLHTRNAKVKRALYTTYRVPQANGCDGFCGQYNGNGKFLSIFFYSLTFPWFLCACNWTLQFICNYTLDLSMRHCIIALWRLIYSSVCRMQCAYNSYAIAIINRRKNGLFFQNRIIIISSILSPHVGFFLKNVFNTEI